MKHIRFLLFLLIFLLFPTVIGASSVDLPVDSPVDSPVDLPVGGVLRESVCVGKNLESAENSSSNFFSSSNISFEDYIVEKCLNYEKNIDVYSFNLSLDEFENKFFDIALRHPELMVVTKFTYKDDERVGVFTPHYLFDTEEETIAARNSLMSKINEYKELVDDVPSDLGKLIILYDKIAYDYSYEQDYLSYRSKGDYSPYHPIGFLLRKKAVCQGYTSLLYKVLEEIGIESDFCISDQFNHIWNYIKLDGNWYHADLTWDDPTLVDGTTLKKTVYHNYFLRSDSDYTLPVLGTSHGEKDSWTKYTGENHDCTSTKYEKNHIFNIPTATTIFYSNNRFILPLTNEIVFESKTPFVGEFALSRPYEVINSSTQEKWSRVVRYCVGDVGREYVTYVKKDEGTDFSIKSFKDVTAKNLFAVDLPKTGSGDKYSIYYFDAKTLAPLSYNVTITDN